MKRTTSHTISLALLMLMILPAVNFAQEHKPPPPNWSILQGTPLRSTERDNMRVDVFKVDNPRKKAIDYAWAMGASIEDTSLVIIWMRGINEDTRIIFTGRKEKGLSTVYVAKSDFEKYFKYCVLSGIKSTKANKVVASFGGGPAGDRDEYWFEWSDGVEPAFYCILK